MGYYATKEYNRTYSVLLTLWKGSIKHREHNNIAAAHTATRLVTGPIWAYIRGTVREREYSLAIPYN